MHQFDELDLWHARREELVREARDGRRARSLRSEKGSARSRPALRWLLWARGHHAA